MLFSLFEVGKGRGKVIRLPPPMMNPAAADGQAKATTENPAAADRQAIACLSDQNYIRRFDAVTSQSDTKVA